MKLQEVKNVSAQRIRITQVRGFALNPGESTKVHPATVKHPAVARYLPPKGKGLELVTQASTEKKVEPIAPDPPQTPAPAVTPAVVEPNAGTQEESDTAPEVAVESELGESVDDTTADENLEASAEKTEEEVLTEPTENVDEAAGKTLRETLDDIDGINDGNIEGVLKAFDSLEDIAKASKQDLMAAGIAASYVKRVKSAAAKA